jgi:hypothetical protein
MSRLARNAVAILLLALAACGPASREAAQRVTAAKPPANYVYLASGDTSEAKNIKVNINFEEMASSKSDKRLILLFGMLFAGAVADAVPAKNDITGGGLSASDPIRFSAAATDAQMQTLNNYLADRFPDRDDLVGHLYRGPESQYVVRTEFDTGAGANSLYFDVTEWVLSKNAQYQN